MITCHAFGQKSNICDNHTEHAVTKSKNLNICPQQASNDIQTKKTGEGVMEVANITFLISITTYQYQKTTKVPWFTQL